MAVSLVGTGPLGTGTSGAAFTPSWGSLPRTAGDLLVTWGFCSGASGITGVAGWQNSGVGNVNQKAMAWKVAAGGDAAPTWGALSGGTWTAITAEFAGCNTITDPSDSRWNSQTIGASTIVATDSHPPFQPGELVISTGGLHYSALASRTLSESFNNGGVDNNVGNNNSAPSALNHYTFGWAIMSADSANGQATLTFTGTPASGAMVVVSFLPAAGDWGVG